jgi:hypothetical protein
LSPAIWGPDAWTFLHSITLKYPDNPSVADKINYKHFFELLQYILPCDSCCYHYKQNLLKHPLTDTVMSGRQELIKWLIDIHNEVNKANNKPILSYTQVLDIYKNKYKKDKFVITTLHLSIMMTVIIIVVIFLMSKNWAKH